MSQGYHVEPTRAEWAEELEQIQRACFPSVEDNALLLAEHYAAHVARFPEGQFTVVEDATGRPVACSTDIRRFIDLDHYQHYFMDVLGDLTLSGHQPTGDWLYGVDIGVHPDHRGKSLSTLLYAARHARLRELGLQGHAAGGVLSGYGAIKDEISADDYLAELVAGKRWDSTISVQLKRGYTPLGIIDNYVIDPQFDNKAAFIVWRNPDLDES